MSRIDPIRSMSSIYGKFHSKQLDAVYSLLWAYSRFQRMERNTEEKKKKKVLRAGQVFLRWTHGLIRSLSGTEGSHPSLLWFSNEEAEAATQARNRLLNALSGGARLGAKGSVI